MIGFVLACIFVGIGLAVGLACAYAITIVLTQCLLGPGERRTGKILSMLGALVMLACAMYFLFAREPWLEAPVRSYFNVFPNALSGMAMAIAALMLASATVGVLAGIGVTKWVSSRGDP